MVATKVPNVFLSHATEDKERFVLDFAMKLQGNGIKVWLDQWEMGPGDSLVDKIFEEGLKEADAVIVVVSKISIAKKWVREELNAATIKRINTGSKLIPVIIDDCEIPEALKSIVWEKISDPSNYSKELERVVASIYGHRSRPPLGAPPAYARDEISLVSGLSKSDSIVLRAIGDEVLRTGDWVQVGTERLWEAVKDTALPREEFQDSLLVLAEHRLIEKGRTVAPFPVYFMPRTSGLEEYFKAFVPGYAELKRRIAVLLLNTELRENKELATETGEPIVSVTHVLRQLEAEGLIKTSGAIGGLVWARDISPRLKRLLSEST
jgi:hypothetical protein